MSIVKNRVVRTALGALLVGTATVAFAVPAFAATVSTTQTGPTTTTVTATPQTLAGIQAAGAAAIAQREGQLTKLGAALAAAASCDTHGVIATEISTDGPALTALGQQLAGDMTIPAAKADFGTIFTTYRVYLVVTPQAYVTAACGHIQTASTKLTADQQKLTVLVAALPAGATKTAAEASLADMTTQLTNATTQANEAAAALAGIVPDHGNKMIEASNAAAVNSAHGQLTTARDDMLAAVNDAKAVVADLTSAV